MSRATITEISDWEHQPLVAAKRTASVISDDQVLMDYAGRTDSQPVYIGVAAKGVATSEDKWFVVRLEYDGSNRMTVKKSSPARSIWDNRAILTYT
jgi:hypothetical protein